MLQPWNFSCARLVTSVVVSTPTTMRQAPAQSCPPKIMLMAAPATPAAPRAAPRLKVAVLGPPHAHAHGQGQGHDAAPASYGAGAHPYLASILAKYGSGAHPAPSIFSGQQRGGSAPACTGRKDDAGAKRYHGPARAECVMSASALASRISTKLAASRPSPRRISIMQRSRDSSTHALQPVGPQVEKPVAARPPPRRP